MSIPGLPNEVLVNMLLPYLGAAALVSLSNTSTKNLALGNNSRLWSDLLSKDFAVSAKTGDPKELYREEHLKNHSWDNAPRSSITSITFNCCGNAFKQKGPIRYMGGLRVRCIMVG